MKLLRVMQQRHSTITECAYFLTLLFAVLGQIKQVSSLATNHVDDYTMKIKPTKNHYQADKTNEIQSIEVASSVATEHFGKLKHHGRSSAENTKALKYTRPLNNKYNRPTTGVHETHDDDHQSDAVKLIRQLQEQFIDQVIRQRVSEKDHLIMEKWLVDNINDLHRGLKQTETDFEHYIQVTQNEQRQLKQQIAAVTSLPLSIPIPIFNLPQHSER